MGTRRGAAQGMGRDQDANFLPCDSHGTSEVLSRRRDQGESRDFCWAQYGRPGWKRVCKRIWERSGKSGLEVKKKDAGNSLAVTGACGL